MKRPNLNSGLGFMYGPEFASGVWPNLSSSTEYGNIAYSGLDDYDDMVAHGMPRLSAEEEQVLKDWGARMMYGEWTHSGYTNWDTGLGFLRWHLMRYWAWSMDGLESLASQKLLSWNQSSQSWAVWVLDRSLELYNRWAPRGALPGYQFNIPGSFSSYPEDDGLLNAARFAVLAAGAARSDLPQVAATQPPGMWAHDPDIRRLVVSTPAYSAGLLKPMPEQGYGGIELTRFVDNSGHPLSGVGGNLQAALGLTIKRYASVVFATQPKSSSGYVQSLWTTGSEGAGLLRGIFQHRLDASASMQNTARDSVVVQHRFDLQGVTTSRQISSRLGGTVEMYFPVWGSTAQARVGGKVISTTAQPASGKTVLLDTGQGASYTAQLVSVPAGATMRMISFPAQPGNPRVFRALLVSFNLPAGQTVSTIDRISAGQG